MKNSVLVILLLLIFVLAGIGLWLTGMLGEGQSSALPASFTISNNTFNITSYALTVPEQEKGLMNTTVTANTFMLFVFPAPLVQSFWMKDTYTPLDIIWINAQNNTGTIVYIVNASTCASYDPNQTECKIYTPTSSANYVIETKSGFVEKYNIAVGDNISFGNSTFA